MKTTSKLLPRFGIVGIAVASLLITGTALAKPEKKTDAAATTDAATKTEGTAKTSVSAKDQMFIKKAAKGGMMEVEMGNLAVQNAKSDDVKSFGKRMVTDHSKAGDELKSIAEKKGAKMPSKKPAVKWTSDKEYMDMMVKDHQADLAEFQKEAQSGSDPDVKAFAAKGAKMVSSHLKMAEQTQGKLK